MKNTINRYHIKVYTEKKHLEAINGLTDKFNTMSWTYSSHAIDNIKYRMINISEVLTFIKSLHLKSEYIFEYYIDNDIPLKICYRIPYKNGLDIILIVSNTKKLITIYINKSDDNHYTLKTELYTKVNN